MTPQTNPQLPLFSDEGINTTCHINDDVLDQCLVPASCLSFSLGVDEVGRGPLYGSVVVAGVILPPSLTGEFADLAFRAGLQDSQLAGLADSKKMSEKKREQLFEPIQQRAVAYVVVGIASTVIDDMNIYQATMLGMQKACEVLLSQMMTRIKQDYPSASQSHFRCLIDGNKLPKLDWNHLERVALTKSDVELETWVKGDGRHTAIAAASVLAKVTRDRDVVTDGHLYPDYGLEKHKGYPTKQHLQALQEHGVLPKHRRSFKPVQQAIEKKRDYERTMAS